MQILFLNGNDELLLDDWSLVPRIGDKVQIDCRGEVNAFHVRAVVWKKDFVKVHVTKEKS